MRLRLLASAMAAILVGTAPSEASPVIRVTALSLLAAVPAEPAFFGLPGIRLRVGSRRSRYSRRGRRRERYARPRAESLPAPSLSAAARDAPRAGAAPATPAPALASQARPRRGGWADPPPALR